jgi:hypothetical protein
MTEEAKLAYLLRLPWTFVRESTPEGDTVLRVAQIPSAVGTGTSDAELEEDMWASLRASLEAYLHFGDPIPVPPGTALPWQPHPPELNAASRIIVRHRVRTLAPANTAAAQEVVLTSR